MTNDYGNDSIALLEGAARVRKNPQNFLGSRGLDGAKHTLIEIIGNATDERLAGFGDDLIVTYGADGSLSVRDFGRGVPLGFNKKYGKWNYFLIYEELFAGGKYEDNQAILREIDRKNQWKDFNFKKYPYLITIGMNGVGGACTQYTSEYFDVISYRDGKASHMYYEKGAHVLDELEITDTDEPNGTYVKWKPDSEVFDDVNIASKWVSSVCNNLSITSGFNVTYIDEAKGTKTLFKGRTIQEEMKELCGVCATNKYFYHTIDDRGDVCVCEAEVAMGNAGGQPKFFNNMIEIHGGSHSLGLTSALYEFFRRVSVEQGVRIKDVDYSGKFSFLLTTLNNKMSLKGQTKDSLDDAYIAHTVYTCVLNMLEYEKSKGTKWIMDIVDDVVYACQVRMAQEELIKNHREIERNIKKLKVSDKFAESKSYREGNVEETEIIVVEGDSAGGRAKTARDYNFQCIMPIRGKSLNVYKATIEKLIENSEIKDFVAALGCGIDLGIDGFDSFDITKLKAGKIYFLPDADIDGEHISMLLFLIFYKLFPQLLYEGKVYIIDTPLYIINLKNGDPIFCMTQEEMEKKKSELGSNFDSVDRFKGLGETDAETLWETTLNPENRIVRQLKLEHGDTELVDVLELLFGKSTDRRKKIILGSLVNDFDSVLEGRSTIEEFLEGLNLNEGYLEYEEYEV
jgi:DNA gyrase subunit B